MTNIVINNNHGSFLALFPSDPREFDWQGWKRVGVGAYTAMPYASSILGMRPTPSQTITWRPEAAALRDSLMGSLQLALNALSSSDPLPGSKWPTAKTPRLHQRRALAAMEHMGYRSLLADEMGLGKTSTALWAAWRADAHRILVVCPVAVKYNWQNEIEETLGQACIPIVIDGTAKDRAGQFSEASNLARENNVAIIINYDLLRHLNPEQFQFLKSWVSGEGFLIFDESHYIKEYTAKRSVLSTEIARQSPHTLALTGTPVRNQTDDLFGQVQAVRPGTWTSYRAFVQEHVVMRAMKLASGREVLKPVGTKNLDRLNRIMNTMQIRRLKSEVTDLPPKVYTKPKLELDGNLREIYKAMADFARMELRKLLAGDDAPSSIWDPRAKSAIEQAMRCEQIAQGFVGGIPDPVMQKLGKVLLQGAEKIPGRPNEIIFPAAPKLVWLMESIESIVKQGGAPLVFSRFNAPMFWLVNKLQELGYKAGMLHGALQPAEKHEVTSSFQAGRLDVLLAQIKMAEGWNAPRSQDVLFLGRDWSPAINFQGEDRAHRMGQKGTVNVQIPIVTGTVEVLIDRKLSAKAQSAEEAIRTISLSELLEAL